MRVKTHIRQFTCLIVLVTVASTGLDTGNGQDVPQPSSPGRRIALPVSQAGVADASLADTGPEGRTWMSYTAVDPSPRWPEGNTRTETTRLAYSDDRGLTWNDLGSRVNEIADVEFGSKKATWVNEVSSLVYDPAASAQDRWQLYWHHYLSIGDNGQWTHGWIGYKSASHPERLIAAKEIKLFAGRIYDRANDTLSSETRPPVGGAPVIQLDTLHDALRYCLALTEPGAIATPSGLYLSLGCVQPRLPSIVGMLGISVLGGETSIILLKCDAPCRPENPKAWRFINTVLNNREANALGYKDFNAPDLFMKGNEAFLIVSPGSDNPVPNAYNGCVVFRFADLGRGVLAGGQDGQPLVVKQIQGRANSFHGACTYQPSVPKSGFIYMDVVLGAKPYFRLFQTGDGL